jgi:RNA polymerase sigma-70 factor, ECF subfamily
VYPLAVTSPQRAGTEVQSDAALAERAAAGDAAAMAALIDRHFDYVHAICERMLRDPAAAEDARQEVLYRAARGIRSFDRRSSFRTWVFAIARRYGGWPGGSAVPTRVR